MGGSRGQNGGGFCPRTSTLVELSWEKDNQREHHCGDHSIRSKKLGEKGYKGSLQRIGGSGLRAERKRVKKVLKAEVNPGP